MPLVVLQPRQLPLHIQYYCTYWYQYSPLDGCYLSSKYHAVQLPNGTSTCALLICQTILGSTTAMSAAPAAGMTDADIVSTVHRILAHAPDAADAPAPVNIPHRLLRDVRVLLLSVLIFVFACIQNLY